VININITVNNKEIEVNLLNDYIFSKVLGEEGCQKETLHVINTFTKRNFKNLDYKPNELKGEYKGNKKSITDVLVLTNDGTFVNVESQIEKQEYYHKRTHGYSSKIQSIFLNVGDDYGESPMVIMINILDFHFHKRGNYHRVFTQCDKDNPSYMIDDIEEIHYIELPKFRKELKKGNIDLNNPKDRLMVLLDKRAPQYLVDKVVEMDEFAKNIYNKLTNVLQDQEEYLMYVRAEQAELDRKAQIRYGKNEGREEGIEIGEERKEVEIAKNLKNEGISIETIAKTTGLSVSKVKEL
jgi:predicted transposase/invertase (TIGR01784 family)